MNKKTASAVAIALALLSGVNWWKSAQSGKLDLAAKGASSEAERQMPAAAATSPQTPQLPRTARGTRAYVVRSSLGVQKLDRAVAESGARIVSRLSRNEAVVEATDEARAKLLACCGVNSAEACARAFKLSPALRERLAKSAPGEPLSISVLLINAADAATVGERIATAGGRVMSRPNVSSRFACMGAEVPSAAVVALADLAEVNWIEPQGALRYSNHESVQAGELDVCRAWDGDSGLGLSGAGQVIGHADTGLDLGDITRLEPEFAGHVKAIYDHTKGAGLRDTDGHGTHTAGSIVGQGIASLGGKYRGVAHGAMLVHQSLCAEGTLFPDDLNALFAEAYREGARIHSDSWGNGNYEYDLTALSLDEFVWTHPDFLPVFAAGNNGDEVKSSISSPGLARNALTVGAAYHGGEVSPFSARGIEDAPRIKPDVLAPGMGIVSVRSLVMREKKPCVEPAAGTRYYAENGTSMAAPLAAGSLALMREWYLREKGESPSVAMLIAMAVGGAAARTGTGVVSDASGWGSVNVAATLAPTNGVTVRLRDERPNLAEQAKFAERFLVTNSSERLVFSLAWLDFPNDPRSQGIIADYDLAVFAPDGTRHWPNGGTGADHDNLRETVVVTNAATGIWTVTVCEPDDGPTGGAVALYARGAFAADTSGAETNVWHVAAGKSIQSAVDQAKSGDTIVLEEGTYAPFVATNKALTIRGAGRDRSIIDAEGSGGVRPAVYLSLSGDPAGIVLEGVTIENGVADFGGGLCGGTLRNSTIRNCTARRAGGGAYNAILDRCIVSNCSLVVAATSEDVERNILFAGGGVYASTLYNCLVADCSVSDPEEKVAVISGGGAAESKLANVTMVGSRLLSDRPGVRYRGGALDMCPVQNTLISGSTLNGTNVAACYFYDRHTSYVAVVGTNAFVNFAAGDYRLSSNAVSAIDAGCTNYVAFYPSATDLCGTNRVMGHSVDLGCYESPYTNALPAAVDKPALTMKAGSLVGFAIGVADAENASLSVTMINDAWQMAAFEKGLAGADAARSELLDSTVTYSNFLEAADRIVDGIQSNDVVLLSVSTHGGNSVDTNGLSVVGSDNLFALSAGILWPSNVVAFAERLEAKGAKLMQVHDTCFSAGFVEMTGRPGVTAVTCQELSLGFLDEGRFTDAFLEAWRHPPADSDLNGDGVLSLYELAVATQRTHCGFPDGFKGTECCIFRPDELAKVAVRKLPQPGEQEPLRVITDRMPTAYAQYSYCFRLRAAGAESVTWSALTELPAGLTLDADGLVRGYAQWGDVTNFQVRATDDDGRWAETNIVLSGLFAQASSRPRLASVSVPQGTVTRRRDDGDWTVRVVAELVQAEVPTSGCRYVFTLATRCDNKTLSCVTNETGTFTVDAATLAAWPDVYVYCEPTFDECPIAEKSAAWFIRTDVPFPASRAGVCSWSWATNMTTILSEMDTMGVKQMQLSLVPWVKPLYGIEYPASLRETFGKGETGDAFVTISNKILRGEIAVLSTMISFPFDCWTSFTAISNSNGIVCNVNTNDTVGESVSTTDPLGLAAWTVNSNLIDQAAAMTRQLGVDYITTEVGYLDKVMMDNGTNANKNGNIGFQRLYEAHRICARHGVRMLFESGQYSGARTMELIDIYTNRYASAPFENEYGLTVNDIGINYDVANHLIYANDTPTNAFTAMRGRIAQIHVKDTYEDLDKRTEICGYAGDVKWGTADVSGKYRTLAFLKNAGYAGNLLVEHEWGDDRVGDIKAALQAILLENNEDGSPWIAPQAMAEATMDECCTAALRAQGFSSSVAGALGGVGLYNSFTNWAVARDLAPSNLVTKSGVIFAAAFDAATPPEPDDVTLAISRFEYYGDGAVFYINYGLGVLEPGSVDEELLKASIGIEGANQLSPAAFSGDCLSVVTNAILEAGSLAVEVQPSASGSQTGNVFFYRAVAR